MNIPAPFSQRQHEYIERSKTARFNIAEGGYRAGKNVMNVYAFCREVDKSQGRLHMIAGRSVAEAFNLIGDCDGLGIYNYFHGSRAGQWDRKPAIFIKDMYGTEKIIVVAGANNMRSQAGIKGYTFWCVYVTEANECDPEFVAVAETRTMSVKTPKMFHDLNPKPEGNWYYEDVLSQYQRQPEHLNYGRFTIADNMSISQEVLERELAKYDKTSARYKRDILGLRIALEGLVYPMFSHDLHVVPPAPRTYSEYVVSNDFGTRHPCVFLLFGKSGGVWYLVDEYYYDGAKNPQKTVEQYYADMKALIGGRHIRTVILDKAPIAASFNIHLKSKGGFRWQDADNEVLAGIQDVATAITTDKLKICSNCKNTIREFGLYSWNSRSVNDEPIKENDDALDSLRYFVRTMNIVENRKQRIQTSNRRLIY